MAESDCHAAVLVAVADRDLAASGDTVADHRDYHDHLDCHPDSLNSCWNCSGSPADFVGSCCYFHVACSVRCGHLRLNWVRDEIKEKHKIVNGN